MQRLIEMVLQMRLIYVNPSPPYAMHIASAATNEDAYLSTQCFAKPKSSPSDLDVHNSVVIRIIVVLG